MLLCLVAFTQTGLCEKKLDCTEVNNAQAALDPAAQEAENQKTTESSS